MSSFDRLARLASQALGSSRSSRRGGSDWRAIVRQAAEAITGEGSATGRGTAQGGPGRPVPGRPDATGHDATGHDASGARGSREGSFQRSFTEHSAQLTAQDTRAIARYDYLVRTADPDQLEQVHREAFARLSPLQRAEVQARMDQDLPASERPRSDAPEDLARSATRLGAMDPRRLEGLLGRAGGRRAGTDALAVGGGLLAAVAGGVVATAVGGSLLQSAIGEGIDVDALAGGLGDRVSGYGLDDIVG